MKLCMWFNIILIYYSFHEAFDHHSCMLKCSYSSTQIISSKQILIASMKLLNIVMETKTIWYNIVSILALLRWWRNTALRSRLLRKSSVHAFIVLNDMNQNKFDIHHYPTKFLIKIPSNEFKSIERCK